MFEHINGILKGRFQSLKSLRVQVESKTDHAWAVYWVKACCVLHNLLQVDEYDDSWTFWEEKDPSDNGVNAESSVSGRQKRERVKNRVLNLAVCFDLKFYSEAMRIGFLELNVAIGRQKSYFQM